MSATIDIHIVSFDVPYPADYGGVIDVYYKLKALKAAGLSIALHCFQYGKDESEELNKLCNEVYYYPRRTDLRSQLSATPYIVASRGHDQLLKNLDKDKAPILFEGLHTTYYLGHKKLQNRQTAVRVHNQEDQYYAALYEQSANLYKKIFYAIESNKLKYYENRLAKADVLFCLSEMERVHYSAFHQDVRYLPVFHPFKAREASMIKHQIDQAVYFGNLAVEENSKAVEFLLEVFEGLNLQLKIAGRGAGSDLVKKMEQADRVEYLGELSDSDLNRLLYESRVCCLPTRQSTGIKLKWIHALHQANQIILNGDMLADEDFRPYCILAESVEEWRAQLQACMQVKQDEKMVEERIALAKRRFNNESSAKLLVEWCAQAQ